MSNKIESYRKVKGATYKLTELKAEAKSLVKKNSFTADRVFSLVDKASASSETWMKQFTEQFALLHFGKKNKEYKEFVAKVKVFSEAEQDEVKAQFACVTLNGEVSSSVQKQYMSALQEARLEETNEAKVAKFAQLTKTVDRKFDVDADSVLETNVLPLIDGLIKSSPLLDRINIINGVEYKKLLEFAGEKDAETLANTNAGTEADDVIRPGLTLVTEDKKIQASTSINDTDLESLDPSEWARFVFRLGNRIRVQAEYQVLYADDTSNGFQRGFINSAGTTDDNRIGSLIVDVSGASDIIESMKLLDDDMPKTMSPEDENLLVYVGNRKLKTGLKMAKDNNGNYYFKEGDSLEVSGHEVINSPSVADGTILLVAPAHYTMVDRSNGISIMNDEGLVELKEGNIIFIAKMKGDGCPRFAHKYAYTGTPDTTTAGDPNNQERNIHRYAVNAY